MLNIVVVGNTVYNYLKRNVWRSWLYLLFEYILNFIFKTEIEIISVEVINPVDIND